MGKFFLFFDSPDAVVYGILVLRQVALEERSVVAVRTAEILLFKVHVSATKEINMINNDTINVTKNTVY